MRRLQPAQSELVAIAIDQDHVYWTTLTEVKRVPKEGGLVETYVSGASPESVVVDATHVYGIDGVAGSVNRMEKEGGRPEELAPGQSAPQGMALGDGHVYWTNGGDGTVKRVPVGGGLVEEVASGRAGLKEITLRDGAVIWTEMDGVAAVYLCGCGL